MSQNFHFNIQKLYSTKAKNMLRWKKLHIGALLYATKWILLEKP